MISSTLRVRECAVYSKMAAPPCFCNACGIATQPNARRLLCSEASATVCQVWSELLGERLKERRIEVAVRSVMEAGCVCKKCFMAVKAFHDRKMQLLMNLRNNCLKRSKMD